MLCPRMAPPAAEPPTIAAARRDRRGGGRQGGRGGRGGGGTVPGRHPFTLRELALPGVEGGLPFGELALPGLQLLLRIARARRAGGIGRRRAADGDAPRLGAELVALWRQCAGGGGVGRGALRHRGRGLADRVGQRVVPGIVGAVTTGAAQRGGAEQNGQSVG